MKIFIQCHQCQKEILRERKNVNTNARRGHKNFCSKLCASDARKVQLVKINCAACGSEILRKFRDIKDCEFSYCNRSCANTVRCGVAHPNFKGGIATYRKRALEYYGAKCQVCSYDILEVLEVHHRDKNRKNNAIENLVVLCPTHHVEFGIGLI